MKSQPTKDESQAASQRWLIIAAGVGCGGMLCATIFCCGVVALVGGINRSIRHQSNQGPLSSKQSDSPYEFKQKPAPTVDPTLVMKLRSGMNGNQVRAILGTPHRENRLDIPAIPALNEPAKVHVTWTYNPDSDGFIVLLFEDGVLCDGGTGGYNINTGLVIPDNIKQIFEDAKQRR